RAPFEAQLQDRAGLSQKGPRGPDGPPRLLSLLPGRIAGVPRAQILVQPEDPGAPGPGPPGGRHDGRYPPPRGRGAPPRLLRAVPCSRGVRQLLLPLSAAVGSPAARGRTIVEGRPDPAEPRADPHPAGGRTTRLRLVPDHRHRADGPFPLRDL